MPSRTEGDDVIAGRYRLLECVGRGGMGTVWLARDELLERDVAVKQLHVETESDGAEKSDVRNQRAMREARITARLHHQHAVPVFDAVEHEGRPYLIMQYFSSRSLQELLADHPTLPPAVVARVGSEVASALAAAHRVGIVHRDVKPGNVLLAADGTAKITDFGIAHVLGDATLTSKGVITGTPAYLAPEVARGEQSSAASDVFSLGATLYRALEGHPPFPHQQNPLALVHVVASGAITPPDRSGHLTPLLLRMLAAHPAERPSMDEVARILGEPGEARPAACPPSPAAAPGDVSSDGAPTVPEPPPPPDGPPTARLPATDQGGGHPRRGKAFVLLAFALAAAVVAAILVVDRRPRQGEAEPLDDTPALGSEESLPGAPGTGTAAPSTAAPSTAVPTTAAPSSGSTPPASGADPTTSVPPAATAATASTGATTTVPTPMAPDEAIRHYYDLLPEDRDAGWALLTDRYRRTTARSRATYESFWSSVVGVGVTDVTSTGPGVVTATVTYDFADGRTFVEQTSFTLVLEGPVLKIDRSEVLSSAQR